MATPTEDYVSLTQPGKARQAGGAAVRVETENPADLEEGEGEAPPVDIRPTRAQTDPEVTKSQAWAPWPVPRQSQIEASLVRRSYPPREDRLQGWPIVLKWAFCSSSREA